MDQVDRAFNKAVSAIQTLSTWSQNDSLPKPPLTNRVKLYALYKQATEGDQGRSAHPPPPEDETSRRKWIAWKKEEGLTKTEAKKRYVACLIDTMKTYAGDSTESRDLLFELEFLWETIRDLKPIPLRSKSPAVSLYRVASGGFNTNIVRPPSRTTNVVAIESSARSDSPKKDLDLIRWQSEINRAVNRISLELEVLAEPQEEPGSDTTRSWLARALGVVYAYIKQGLQHAVADSLVILVVPGRKPLTTEPKNKRTAQNRAAQRAFRERKERKMKELESKVKLLEDEKLQITNETELLRSQVYTLLQELSKYRPVDQEEETRQSEGQKARSIDASDSAKSSPVSADSTTYSTLETPVSSISSSNVKDISGSSASSSSSFQFPSQWGNSSASPGLTQSELNQSSFKGDFDEGVSDFCAELGQVCGSKDCPIPKAKQQVQEKYASTSSSSLSIPELSPKVCESVSSATTAEDIEYSSSPFYNLLQSTTSGTTKPSDEMNFLLDSFTTPNPTAFNTDDLILGNDLEDYSGMLKKDTDDDTLGGLVTEVSKYDPLDELLGSQSQLNLITPATLPIFDGGDEKKVEGDDDSNETVPNTSGKMMKCSQIWERITSHPRFSEIDIDGLCSELKQKAKCSEHGVVVNGGDVGKLITNALDKKGSEVKENRFLKGLAC
ncbi:hypothetical protein FOA43_002985 [Brettanomyces nanus]|uniref:BZIP domain-containing protein n=1 Tax=Eeniella nana TaxID=13502 RepID=A0A875S3U6_EENNA|nr:uncharacterized protein FOA43_002985 [Brettanomyces nanus]QPG75628.1 hypothetical protein FOA43_002985 [Brettanomyces nanus]